jgi:teichuronic acid biosynthesis glycosyltransferase TuaG
MNGNPVVSIVIPTYNHAPYLKEALESVRSQVFTDWEAIVVNNYSEDNTIEVVESFNDPRIILVNFHNHGCIAASRNEGIRRARAELVAFLDSDDIWYSDKLKFCLAALQPQDGLVVHEMLFIRDGIRLQKLNIGTEERATFERLLYEGNCITTSATIIRKEALLAVGSFSEDKEIITAEDFDLWLKLIKLGVKPRFISKVLGDYRLHAGNASKSFLRQMDATLKVLGRHFPDRPSWEEKIKIRRRKAIMYSDFGRVFQKNGNRLEALKLFTKSIATFPFTWKVYLAACLLLYPGKVDY